jgi:hypothetical protein
VENFRRAGVYIPVLTPLAQRFADIARREGFITVDTTTTTTSSTGGGGTVHVVQNITAPSAASPQDKSQ